MSVVTLPERAFTHEAFPLEGLRGFDDPVALEDARLAVEEGIVVPCETLWVPPDKLAGGFREYTKGLGCSEETLDAFDRWQWLLGERDWGATVHGRLVGSVAGAGMRAVGGELFGSPLCEAETRINAGLHDVGKLLTLLATLMRTYGPQAGYGIWVDKIDRPNMDKHPRDGARLLRADPYLPEGGYLIAGTHHGHKLEGKMPYGMRPGIIDRLFAHDPFRREFLKLQSKVTVGADEFEAATGRPNYYTCHGRQPYESMAVHLEELFPGQGHTLLAAFHYERSRMMQACLEWHHEANVELLNT